MDDLKKLQRRIVRFNKDRKWNKYHKPKDLAISIAIEAAELLECFQWKSKKEVEEYLKSDKSFEIQEEMADILKYLLNMANILDIDIIKAAHEKLEKDIKKYPVNKVKGKYRKYTEL